MACTAAFLEQWRENNSVTCEPCRAGSVLLRGNRAHGSSSSVTRVGAKRGCSAPLAQNNIPGFGVPSTEGEHPPLLWPLLHEDQLAPGHTLPVTSSDFSAGLSPSASITLFPTAAVIPRSLYLPVCIPPGELSLTWNTSLGASQASSLTSDPELLPHYLGNAHSHTHQVWTQCPFMFPQASCSATPGSSWSFFSQSGTPCYLLVQFFLPSTGQTPEPAAPPSPGPGYSSVFAPGRQTHTQRAAGSHQPSSKATPVLTAWPPA